MTGRPQPRLATGRLELRPAGDDDLDALWTIWADPDVRRYLFDDVPVTRERAAEVLAESAAAASKGLGLWSVRTSANAGAIIGCAGLLPVTTMAEYDPSLAGSVEPVIALAPAMWGCGYASEALRAVIRHAFDTLDMTSLGAATDVPNVASDRALRRVGFVPALECDGPKYRLRTYRLRRGEEK
jgi:RimJ/RimL family protein N-acetyltransferase